MRRRQSANARFPLRRSWPRNAGKFVGAQGIQLHGGIGMTEEYAVGHYYKKLIAFEKRFGDTEYHLSRYLQHEPR